MTRTHSIAIALSALFFLPCHAADTSRVATIAARGKIVPRVDHHQHLTGPTAVILPPAPLPPATLPPALERVMQERNRIQGTADIGELYTTEPQIVLVVDEAQPWLRGRDAVQRMVNAYRRDSRFVANAFGVDGSTAWISGSLQLGERAMRHFTFGLQKDASGAWRIASEQVTAIEPYQFAEPITGDQLVEHLDIAGIERAVVLSVAYWFGSPNRKWPGDEYANVRKENDWTAAEAARHPDRLVPFCGVSPLREYAVREVRRCATELGMKGLKLHFGSSRVDVLDAEHLAKVKEVFRAANEQGMAIIVHTRPARALQYTRDRAEVFLEELLPAAPDVVVQIAHFWGGNEFSPIPLGVLADAVAARDPRTKNLYFDLTEVETVTGHSADAMETIAKRIRQVGLSRVLYGSDATTARGTAGDLEPVLRWSRLRNRLPLTNEELAAIADNVAPYLRK